MNSLACRWADFLPTLDKKNILLVPFCERKSCEEKIKADSTKEYGTGHMGKHQC